MSQTFLNREASLNCFVVDVKRFVVFLLRKKSFIPQRNFQRFVRCRKQIRKLFHTLFRDGLLYFMRSSISFVATLRVCYFDQIFFFHTLPSRFFLLNLFTYPSLSNSCYINVKIHLLFAILGQYAKVRVEHFISMPSVLNFVPSFGKIEIELQKIFFINGSVIAGSRYPFAKFEVLSELFKSKKGLNISMLLI
jgi:hypothetical protein